MTPTLQEMIGADSVSSVASVLLHIRILLHGSVTDVPFNCKPSVLSLMAGLLL